MAVYQSLTLTQLSQDIKTNTSQVHILWQSTQTGSSYNHYANPATYWVSINGGAEFEETENCILPYRETQTLAETTVTVDHDEKGEATVTVRTRMDTKLSAGVVELTKTLVLTPIPRASTVTASDGVVGGISRIAVGRKNQSFSHSLLFTCGQFSGYITENGQISDTECRMTKESIDFVLSELFYEAMPDAPQVPCTLLCRTYEGDTPIGEPQSCTFAVQADKNACCPLLTGSAEDVNPITLALTGDSRVMVQGVSDMLCTLQAEARQGAVITERRISGISLAPGQDQMTLTGWGGQLNFSVTDSRGYCVEFTPDNPVIFYTPPTVKAQVTREHPTNGTATLTVEGQWFSGSFGASKNILQIAYRIDGGPWKMAEPVLTEGAYSAVVSLTDMVYSRVYPIELRVEDALCYLERSVTLKKSIPVFDWGENDFCFHVPVNVDGSITIGGRSLLDIFYPIGTVYCHSGEEDPTAFFGGKWTALSTGTDGECKWLRVL